MLLATVKIEKKKQTKKKQNKNKTKKTSPGSHIGVSPVLSKHLNNTPSAH